MLGKKIGGIWFFTEEEKHQIIQEYLSGGISKSALWRKYTGKKSEHGSILRWMRQLGYSSKTSGIEAMKEKKSLSPSLDLATLEAENAALKKALAQAGLQAQAYATMLDVASEKLGIDIRKKSVTKASKS